MPNKYSAGCECCGACAIFFDLFDQGFTGNTTPSTDWTQVAGTWEVRHPTGFPGTMGMVTDDDNSLIVAEIGPSDSGNSDVSVAGTKAGATFGAVVSYLDSDNYLYIKITNPTLDTTAPKLEIVERVDGVESTLRTRYGTIPEIRHADPLNPFGYYDHWLRICTTKAKAGYKATVHVLWVSEINEQKSPPMISRLGSTREYVDACFDILGQGVGFRTDSLLGGFGGAVRGNIIGESGRPHLLGYRIQRYYNNPSGDHTCTCNVHCDLQDETAPSQLTLTMSGWGLFTSALNDKSPYTLEPVGHVRRTVNPTDISKEACCWRYFGYGPLGLSGWQPIDIFLMLYFDHSPQATGYRWRLHVMFVTIGYNQVFGSFFPRDVTNSWVVSSTQEWEGPDTSHNIPNISYPWGARCDVSSGASKPDTSNISLSFPAGQWQMLPEWEGFATTGYATIAGAPVTGCPS